MEVLLRIAEKHDLPEVLDLIKELASYERAADEVTITLEDLEDDGFGKQPMFRIILASVNDQIVGMAFYFISYSTWKGKCLYLEDIIVKEEYRGAGVGKVLFDEMVRTASQFGAKRLSWQVLDWNEPAIHFYKRYGAHMDPEWINGKLTEEQLKKF